MVRKLSKLALQKKKWLWSPNKLYITIYGRLNKSAQIGMAMSNNFVRSLKKKKKKKTDTMYGYSDAVT